MNVQKWFKCQLNHKLNDQTVFSHGDLGSTSSRPPNRRQHAAVPARDLYIRFFTCMNVRDTLPVQLMRLRNQRISTQTVRGCLRYADLSAGHPHGGLEFTAGSANAYFYRNLTFQIVMNGSGRQCTARFFLDKVIVNVLKNHSRQTFLALSPQMSLEDIWSIILNCHYFAPQSKLFSPWGG